MNRLILSFAIAAGISIGIFAVMDVMVNPNGEFKGNAGDQAVIDFVRLKQDSETRTRDRNKKEPPKPKKPPVPQQKAMQSDPQVPQLAINMPKVSPDLSLASKNLLGDAQVGMGFGDGDVIPLVRMPAQYPSKAMRRNIEGYVRAQLEVNEKGTVDSVKVIDSKPKGVFERSAIKALYKYKFKPHIVDGKPQSQTVTQTLDFVLDKN